LELDAARQSYFDLYDLAPVGYLVLSEQGLILQANLAVATLLGVLKIDLIKQSIHNFILGADQDSFYLFHKQLVNTGKPQTYDLRMVTNEGTQFWANLAATSTLDSNDQPLLWVVLSDITDRKQAEFAIQKSKEAKQDILNSISAHIAVLDHDGVILSVNDPWIRFAQENSTNLGNSLSKSDVGTNYLLAYQPVGVGIATNEAMIAHDGIQAVLDRRELNFSLEYACHSKLEQRWFSMNVTPLGVKKLGGVVITHTEITQRKLNMEALRHNQIMLARTERLAHIGSWEWNLVTDTVKWSDELFRIFQRNPTDGAPTYEEHEHLYHPEDIKQLKDAVEAAVNHGIAYRLELRAFRKDGQTRVCIATGQVGVDPNQIDTILFGSLHDITERKQAELDARATQEQLELMTAQVPGVVYQFVLTVSGAWRFLYLSKGIEELYEVTADEVLRDFSVLTQCILAEDQAAHQEAIEHLAQNLGNWEHEHRIRTPSGKIKWVQSRANPKRQTDGSILWSGLLTDITEQKWAEVDIKEREQRYRAFLQDASDTIMIADLEGNIEEVNRSGELLLGYTQEDLRGMNISQIHPASEMSKVQKKFKDSVINERFSPIETKILRKNGQVVDVEIRSTLIKIDGRVWVQGIFIDLTERKCFEDQRIVHEMSLRSVLVREVHHRIKNNLQGITGLLRQFIQTHPETAIPINQAISQVQSICVIHGLQGRAVTSSVRACELTVAIAAGVEALWQKTVLVEIPEDWKACIVTEAEAVPLALVLNELILNAVKHSPKQEPIRITLSHQPHPASIRLDIHNAGQLPVGFGLEDTTRFGTGLQLAVSLLPRAGASLTWTQQNGIVITTLNLDKPVIQLESST
jgi:PAS domain S-box-containing protein